MAFGTQIYGMNQGHLQVGIELTDRLKAFVVRQAFELVSLYNFVDQLRPQTSASRQPSKSLCSQTIGAVIAFPSNQVPVAHRHEGFGNLIRKITALPWRWIVAVEKISSQTCEQTSRTIQKQLDCLVSWNISGCIRGDAIQNTRISGNDLAPVL